MASARTAGLRTLAIAAWLAVATLVDPSAAYARKQRDFGYRYEQVWSAAVRLLRVDLHARVEDQDATNGFVLFEIREGNRTHTGSLEVIRGELRGQPSVRAIVHLASLPSYQEALLLDKLERKLRDDFGEPITRIARPDAGTTEAPADAGVAGDPNAAPADSARPTLR